jgi:hypothetical protein
VSSAVLTWQQESECCWDKVGGVPAGCYCTVPAGTLYRAEPKSSTMIKMWNLSGDAFVWNIWPVPILVCVLCL